MASLESQALKASPKDKMLAGFAVEDSAVEGYCDLNSGGGKTS